MKKILSLVLIIAMVMTIAIGCSNDKSKFEDGVFSAEGELDENGWKPKITIKVEDGKIEDVDYDEIDDQGLLKSEDEEYSETMESVSGITPKDAYEQLEKALKSSQDVDKIDAVAGATGSSEQFKSVAKEALKTK